jgi:hypothetical protein
MLLFAMFQAREIHWVPPLVIVVGAIIVAILCRSAGAAWSTIYGVQKFYLFGTVLLWLMIAVVVESGTWRMLIPRSTRQAISTSEQATDHSPAATNRRQR